MASRQVVVNEIVFEVEDGERVKPRGAGAVGLAKCRCKGNGCEDIAIEYPGTGFIVRNTGKHRVRVGMRPATVDRAPLPDDGTPRWIYSSPLWRQR
jgi:hypothetical protein